MNNFLTSPLMYLPVFSLASCIAASAVQAETIISSLEDQTGVAVTIYNDDLALVKDQRKLNIPRGEHDIELQGVSGAILPETALLRNMKKQNGLEVLEQNFDYDLLSPQKLLEKSLGKNVDIVRTNPATGKETQETAKVLSTNNGVIVQIGDRLETNPTGRFIFSELPENLRATPTLTTTVSNQHAGQQPYELSYLTTGLGWRADYVAEITSENNLNLASWITLHNRSETTYKDAKLQLVAGDVNRVRPEQVYEDMVVKSMAMRSRAPQQEAEDLLEYKLYSLPRNTTLANNQTKQVSLFNASEVRIQKTLIFSDNNSYFYYRAPEEKKMKADIELSFINDKKSNLGLPLPKGTIRVYQQDSQGNAQFVGEDRIDHTSENETVNLTLGQSFDVTAKKTQIDFEKLGNEVHRSSYTVVFNNAKDQEQRVKYRENSHGEWEIDKSNYEAQKVSNRVAEWTLTIPAKSKLELTYRVTTK